MFESFLLWCAIWLLLQVFAAVLEDHKNFKKQLKYLDEEHAKAKSGLRDGKFCIKCGHSSGNDWGQCGGICPVPCSPHYDPEFRLTEWLNNKPKEERGDYGIPY